MDQEAHKEYLTLEEASAYLGVSAAYLRRVLRSYGLGEIMRASMGKQVLIRRRDLDKLPRPARQTPARRQSA